MSKLILYCDGAPVGERELDHERITIGREPRNDLLLSHPAVSGQHAVVITIRNDSFLEDLGSTNGTWVNGKLIEKCLLCDGDEIRIAAHTLKFVFEPAPRATRERSTDELSKQIRLAQQRMTDAGETKPDGGKGRFSSTMALAAQAGREGTSVGETAPAAGLRLLNGLSAGKTVDLVRTTTSLGKPGIQVAVITRGPAGYDLIHLDGEVPPSLNGVLLGERHEALKDHDIIEVAGTKLEFFLKK